MASRRQRRVSQLLEEEISLIAQELGDPLLAYVSVTDVEVTPDLRHAHVFVSQICDAEESGATLKALEHASGQIRRELAERGGLRFVPDLSFHCWRHYAITEMRNSGVARDVRTQVVGHQDGSVHELYTHDGVQLMQQAVNCIY